MTSLSLQYGRYHYSPFVNIQTPTTSTFFNRFRWNWYQNSWFIKIFHIKHGNIQVCRPLWEQGIPQLISPSDYCPQNLPGDRIILPFEINGTTDTALRAIALKIYHLIVKYTALQEQGELYHIKWRRNWTILLNTETVKPVSNSHFQKDWKLVFKSNNRLMQVKSIAECSKRSILQYFQPSLSYRFVIKIFVLSTFEWLFFTSFTVQ